MGVSTCDMFAAFARYLNLFVMGFGSTGAVRTYP